ncbi:MULTISPECIES: hypothetical protein [unclassified Microcoleus]|uniref:hypothetical protein n=1 Tax=unclassified Microcoleus TaxID=2642155 RepID=UPI002FD1B348
MNTLVSANYVKKSDRTFIEVLRNVRSLFCPGLGKMAIAHQFCYLLTSTNT